MSDHSEVFLRQLEKGKSEFDAWRARVTERMTVTGLNLQGKNLAGWDLTGVNFNSTNFRNTDLTGANFFQSTLFHPFLQGANLTGACFCNCDIKSIVFSHDAVFANINFDGATIYVAMDGPLMATFDNCKFRAAKLVGSFRNSKFLKCCLDNATFAFSRLDDATFDGSSLRGAHLEGARLAGASCRDVDFSAATMSGVILTEVDIYGANFFEANLTTADLSRVKNAERASNLEKTIFASNESPKGIEKIHRTRFNQWCDWESIKVVGRMQLFGVSYFLLIYLVTSFYVIGQYNEKIDVARAWADQAQSDGNAATKALATKVLERLHEFPIGLSSVCLLFATLLLVGASIIFTFGCPPEVKDFSSTEWRYAHGRSLVHYWPLAWKRPWTRIICVTLYAIGGAAFLVITLDKIYVAVEYALRFVG